jgi:predicted AAA+ superfamily ATPase
LSDEDAVAMDWLEDLIRTYLERDVPQMGFRVPASRLRRLWTMLAHSQGESVNCSKLGGNLEIDGKTVSHYLDILVDLLLVRRLAPWYADTKKRLVKSPRFYIRDSGIVHRLLGIDSHEALLSHPVLGKSWEGFVIENLLSVLPRRAETYYYRTAAGAEIDLVVKLSSSDIWAVEIKHGTAPKLGKHFNQTCEDIGATRKFVVYGGDEEFPAGDGVTVISLRGLMNKLGLSGGPPLNRRQSVV